MWYLSFFIWHFIYHNTLQVYLCIHAQLLSHVQIFATLCKTSLPGFSVREIFQARILEWVAISFSAKSIHIVANGKKKKKKTTNKNRKKEKKRKEIKICIETNENENTTTQNLWDTVKAVLGKVHSNTGTPQETRKKSNK